MLSVGDSIQIHNREFRIKRISSAAQEGARFGLVIRREVPVYFLEETTGIARGAYVPKLDIVLAFENTDEETMAHELTHVIEHPQEASPGLVALYNRARNQITEESFDGGFVSFNFAKNIHEFIADGRTRPALIEALKREGLHEDFLKETDYLFM